MCTLGLPSPSRPPPSAKDPGPGRCLSAPQLPLSAASWTNPAPPLLYPSLRLITMVGPLAGPALLPLPVVKGREGLTVSTVRPGSPRAQVSGGSGERGCARDPSLPALPFPAVPGHPPHTPQSQEWPFTKLQRPRQSISATLPGPDWRERVGGGD